MAIVLAVVLMSARADDEALLKQAEAWTDEQLLGRFYVEQARAGINIVKDLLRGGTPPAPQLQEMEAFRRELEAIFANHEPGRPDPTVARLVLSANEKVAEAGVKALRYGDFPEAFAEVKRSRPEIAKLIENDRARRPARRAPTDPVVLRGRLLDLLKRTLGDMRTSPNSSMGENYFSSATNAYFGEDMKAWEGWLTRNETYMGVIPGVRTSATGEGILYVDEEAKAAGVPWVEWRTMGDEERAGRLKGKKAVEGWKHLQVVFRVSDDTLIGRPRAFGSLPRELDLSPDSNHLAYWLLLLRRELKRDAAGWDLRVRVAGPPEPARRLAARCQTLGFAVKIGPDTD